MKTTKQPIGLDANFREVFPGDEVRDADGTSYTIMANGWAKPLGGGNEVTFKRLKEPTVTLAAAVIPGPTPRTRKVQPALSSVTAVVKAGDRITAMVAEAVPPGHEITDIRPDPYNPGEIVIESKPVMSAPRIPKRHGGGKKNKSGWSKLNAICHALGVSGQGITGYLRDHGFEVYRAEGTSCVKVEDREKVVAFLRQNPPPAGLPKTSSYDGAVRRIRKDVEAGKARKNLSAPSSIPIPESPAIVTTDPAKVFTKIDAFRILEDADMVAELRHRGWTVTCVKHTEL